MHDRLGYLADLEVCRAKDESVVFRRLAHRRENEMAWKVDVVEWAMDEMQFAQGLK